MFYNNQRSGYEEIKSYYPVWYSDIKEMDAIFRLAGNQLDAATGQMEAIITNRYISSMDVQSLDDMLQYLELDSFGKSIEEKRNILLAAWNGSGKVSGSIIKKVIKTFLGQEIKSEINFSDILSIAIYKNTLDEAIQKELMKYLAIRIPAHMAVNYQYRSKANLQSKLYIAPSRMDFIKIVAEPDAGDKQIRIDCELKAGIGVLKTIKLVYGPE